MFNPNPKSPPKEKPFAPYKYQRKVTGEAQIFRECWNERPHICTNCGGRLLKPKPHNFSHIKSKGAHPELRLEKSNIQILCRVCHFFYDQGTKQQYNDRKGINKGMKLID